MSRLLWLFLSGCFILAACQNKLSQSVSLPQDELVQTYFNYRQNITYTDPYRQIQRQGDDLETVIVREIENANYSVDLAVQELNLPLIAKALARKQQAGVKVRVILDNNYSRILSALTQSEVLRLNQRDRLKYEQFRQLVDFNGDRHLSNAEIAQRDALFILKQAGVALIDDTADGSKGSGLMHHKFIVIDEKKVVTGSANYTMSGIHGDMSSPKTLGNANHLLVIKSDRLASLFVEEFNYMWGDLNQQSPPRFGLAKPFRSPVTITINNSVLTLQFSPTSKSQDWDSSTNGLIGKTLNNASNTIDLALFVFSEQEIADILQTKQQQGLNIRGVFDPGFAWRYYSEVLDLLGVSLFNTNKRQGDRCQVEASNNPWRNSLKTIGVANVNSGDKLHHKFALIDRQIIISGSQNWSNAANRHNDETLIVIDNFTVARHFQQEFARLYESAVLGLSPQIVSKLERQNQQCN